MNKTLNLKKVLTGILLITTAFMMKSVVAENLMYAKNEPVNKVQSTQSSVNNKHEIKPIQQTHFIQLSSGNKKIAQALFDAQFIDRTAAPIEIELSTAYWSLEKIAFKNSELNSWGHVFEEMKSAKLVKEQNLGQVIRNHSDMMRTNVSDKAAEKTNFEKKSAIVVTNARGEYFVINRTDSEGPDSL